MPDAEFASSVTAAAFAGQLFAAGAFSTRHHLREAYVVSAFSDAVAVAASASAVITAVVEGSGYSGQFHRELKLIPGYLGQPLLQAPIVTHYLAKH